VPLLLLIVTRRNHGRGTAQARRKTQTPSRGALHPLHAGGEAQGQGDPGIVVLHQGEGALFDPPREGGLQAHPAEGRRLLREGRLRAPDPHQGPERQGSGHPGRLPVLRLPAPAPGPGRPLPHGRRGLPLLRVLRALRRHALPGPRGSRGPAGGRLHVRSRLRGLRPLHRHHVLDSGQLQRVRDGPGRRHGRGREAHRRHGLQLPLPRGPVLSRHRGGRDGRPEGLHGRRGGGEEGDRRGEPPPGGDLAPPRGGDGAPSPPGLPQPPLAESLSLPFLPGLRLLHALRLVAGGAGEGEERDGDREAHRGHEEARQDAGGGPGPGEGAPRGPEGEGGAPHARGPGPERPRARLRARLREGHGLQGDRALLARHAHRLPRGGETRGRGGAGGPDTRHLPRGHGLGRSQDPRRGSHRLARAAQARLLRRTRGLLRGRERDGFLHHHQVGARQGREDHPPGGRGHRVRLAGRTRVRGNLREAQGHGRVRRRGGLGCIS